MSRNLLIVCIACLSGMVMLTSHERAQVPDPQTTSHSPQAPVLLPNASSLELVPMTTLEALNHADRVIYARVASIETKRASNGNIFTYTTLNIIKGIKGNPGTQITVRLLGGRIDNEIVVGPLEITFKPMDRYVLFLGKNNSEQYPTLLPQAIFQVKSSGGVDVVDPLPTGLTLYHVKTDKAYSSAPGFVTLEDFLHSLDRGRHS